MVMHWWASRLNYEDGKMPYNLLLLHIRHDIMSFYEMYDLFVLNQPKLMKV